MKEQFTNLFPVTKNIQMEAIPVGKTEEFFEKNLVLDEDVKRAEAYETVKICIDRVHKEHLNNVLNDLVLEHVDDYAELYFDDQKDDSEKQSMLDFEADLRRQISEALKKPELFKTLFSANILKDVLPSYLESEKEKKAAAMFDGFYTYFSGYNKVRRKLYDAEDDSSTVAHRCITENLPKFLDNVRSFMLIAASLPAEQLDELNKTCLEAYNVYAKDAFCVDYFSLVLSQSGIDTYNGLIGGYSKEDGTKVKGVNEYVNLYNQQIAKKDKNMRLPLLKQLYKQMLTERTTLSYIPEAFESDDDVVSAVNDMYIGLKGTFAKLVNLVDGIESYDDKGIFVKSGKDLTDLSNSVFGTWRAITLGFNQEYRANNPIKKRQSEEKYYEAMEKAFNKIASFSLFDVQRLCSLAVDKPTRTVKSYYISAVRSCVSEIEESYDNAKDLLTKSYSENFRKKLSSNAKAASLIKELLDNIKELENILKSLLGTGKETGKDEVFYGEFVPLVEEITTIDKLYNKVRNYISKKPYSNDKIKLNFSNSLFLGGWDKNQERVNRAGIFRKDGTYYLAVMDKSDSKIFMNAPTAEEGEECYEKMEYKLLPQPNKMLPKVFFSQKYMKDNPPTEKIMEIYKKGTFKKGPDFNINDCHALIDFYKEAISNHPDWSQFGFKFSDTKDYRDTSGFFNEIADQGYKISFVNIPCAYIDECIDQGRLYFFRLHNKDCSEYAHGTPTIHTMLFRALFDERNLKDVCVKLSGNGEMYYRKPSISDEDKITHPANQPINNKNPENAKKTSTFEYELVKDRRYTRRQFSVHFCLGLNFKAHGNSFINNDVRLSLHRNDNPYIIGVCRGESNLVYVTVLDSEGKIVEQRSLNIIGGSNGYKVDYNKLLDRRVKERDEARKSWGSVEQIKDLKTGYISQILHEICVLILKYDAIVVLEDLNFGAKSGNFDIEKQIFEKFENMLISKLAFLFDKKKDITAEGGLLKAYQLTNPDMPSKVKQNGIVFYMSTWYTNDMDPTTGFVDLIHPKYTSVKESQELFQSFDDIRYNAAADMFEFDIDYGKFRKGSVDFKKKWTICSNGDRIRYFRNKENKPDFERVILTSEFKNLFREFGIDFTADLKNAVLSITNKDFCYRLVRLIALTLQSKNRIYGSTRAEDNFLISPVRNADGGFFDSRDYIGRVNATLPVDIDANGAYNIGRKGLWAVDALKNAVPSEIGNTSLAITNAEWLEYIQK